MLLSAVMCAKPLRHRNVNIKLYINQATKKKISTSDYLRNEFIGHVNTSELSISSSLYFLLFFFFSKYILFSSFAKLSLYILY
jgi:hypothetical protein